MDELKKIDILWDDDPVDVSSEANFIWSIANKLRGTYMPDKYGDVIIPMTVLRRFECTLEPTKDKVLETFEAWAEGQAADDARRVCGDGIAVTVAKPNYEGVRVNLSGPVKGWFLLRMSLHDPIMPLNIESSEEGGIEAIENVLRAFFSDVEGVDSSAL